MIRVLQIVPTLGYGGVAQFLLNYYSRMDKSEIIFDFVTHGKREIFHDELEKSGSKVYYFKSISQIGLREYQKQLKSVFEDNQYDIVHTHDGHVTGITAFLCKKYYRGKVICHAHTTLCTNPKHRFLMPVFRFMARHYSDMLLGCGRLACEYCFGKKSDYSVIHNAVDVDKFNSVSQSDVIELKNQLNIPLDYYVIGHVGAFINQKNHEFIVKIIQEMYGKNNKFVFVLVGDGNLRNTIEDEINRLGMSSVVRFTGIQKNIPLYMNMFDVFILPSHFEGLPVVGVEAQSVGLKCIFSNKIDMDLDTGLGNVSFIPISDQYVSKWVDDIMTPYNKTDYNITKDRFISLGYEIDASVNTLINKYKECVNT